MKQFWYYEITTRCNLGSMTAPKPSTEFLVGDEVTVTWKQKKEGVIYIISNENVYVWNVNDAKFYMKFKRKFSVRNRQQGSRRRYTYMMNLIKNQK